MATVDVATGIRSRIEVRDLDMMYGDRVIQRDLNFAVEPEDIFVIMGPSGSGKSTLLRHMIGLVPPARGDVYYDHTSFWTADAQGRQRILRRVGVLYQEGALWSSMTLAENIGLVVEEFTDLPPATIREVASLKLALVGLAGFEDFYPRPWSWSRTSWRASSPSARTRYFSTTRPRPSSPPVIRPSSCTSVATPRSGAF